MDHKGHYGVIGMALLFYLHLYLGPSHVVVFLTNTFDKYYQLKEAIGVHALNFLKLVNGYFDHLNVLASYGKVQQTWQT